MSAMRFFITAALCLALFLLPNAASAAVPSTISYQGYITTLSGSPASGPVDITFTLYSSPAGTAVLWTETESAVPLVNGVYSVSLGSVTPLNLPFDQQYWLGVKVGTDPEMTPRQALTSVPFAFRAMAADTVNSSSQVISSVPTGSAPLVVSSTTMVQNLNAEMLGGKRADDLWQTSGNAGTVAGANFIGTTDNQQLDLRANNVVSFRIQPTASFTDLVTYYASPNLIGGYDQNSVAAGVLGATISGGGGRIGNGGGTPNPNQVFDIYGTVAGGANNSAGSNDATIDNAPYATVGGGLHNTASGQNATVSGGWNNSASGNMSSVSGGDSNMASSQWASVGGGVANMAANRYAAVGGGWWNTATGQYATIGGGHGNSASDVAATVGGGDGNAASAWATIGGGQTGTASGFYSTVGGGRNNTASNQNATVGGGYANMASGQYATVSGGNANMASALYASVSGGNGNTASGPNAMVSGGGGNIASGPSAMVSGGAYNVAGGELSFAAGYRAIVRDAVTVGNGSGDQGTFVWADYQNTDFISTGPNQFLVRASGGVGINTNAPAAGTLDVNGQVVIDQKNFGGNAGLLVKGGNPGANYPNIGFSTQNTNNADVYVGGLGANLVNNTAGSESADLVVNTATGGASTERMRITSAGNVGIGTNSPNRLLQISHSSAAEMNLQVFGGLPDWRTWNILVDGGPAAKQNLTFRILNDAGTGQSLKSMVLWNDGNAWLAGSLTQASDIRLKTDIQPLDDPLAKVLRIRGVSYRMKDDDTNTRRIGVIAQEIEKEFPELVLTDDKGMKSVAYANLAPVLIEAVKEQQRMIEELKAEVAALKEMLAR